jgi:hypothetical protein
VKPLSLLVEALSRLKMKTLFISAVGGDPLGAMLLDHCQHAKMVSKVTLICPACLLFFSWLGKAGYYFS